MLTKKIFSLQHPLVRHWKLLVTDRTYRQQHQTLLITGEKLILEVQKKRSLKSFISIHETSPFPIAEHFCVTYEMLKKITGLPQPDGWAAELDLPPPQDLKGKKQVLVLDQIQDPGNLGTLLRTAWGLGWEGVFLTPGTVDLFNDKALRSAKGASLFLPYQEASSEEIVSWVHEEKGRLLVADIQGSPLEGCKAGTSPVALVLSHESKGPADWTRNVGEFWTIPMREEVDSLNVAASGAIFLYMLSGERHAG